MRRIAVLSTQMLTAAELSSLSSAVVLCLKATHRFKTIPRCPQHVEWACRAYGFLCRLIPFP